MADNKKGAAYAIDYVKADHEKATYTDNPHIDNLIVAFHNMGSEVWTMRRRLMVIEKFLDEKNVALKQQIEAYQPTDAENLAWNKTRDEYLRKIFDPLTQPREKVGGTPPQGTVPPINRT